MAGARSKKLFHEAEKHIPGGVNSPVRAFRSVGGDPLFIQRAKGSKIYDADGKTYIDYVLSWGPMILGHAHPSVVAALKKTLPSGTSYGAPTAYENVLAKMVKIAFPSIDLVRMVSSGTEATMSAIRVARGFTGRDKIIKFDGCYHGHGDSLLVKAGSGVATFGLPDSPGVPSALAALTHTLPYNDLGKVQELVAREGEQIACIIVEPVAGNMGCVPPQPGFLEGLRNICDEYGIILIFDEVMTGFRIAFGGAQERYKVQADLTCLGKIIGGGLPVGAYGGKQEIMQKIAPLGPIYQAGTLSGNPLAMIAGIETLKVLAKKGVYSLLEKRSQELENGFREAAHETGIPMTFNRIGSMFTGFFTGEAVYDFTTAKKSNTALFSTFFRAMLKHGINIAPSQFEAGFLSLAHTHADIAHTIEAARKSLKGL
ncbi:MAG: glutamate-1-semialdehyde 2,1-aminomutase [Nitrospirota bacterium]